MLLFLTFWVGIWIGGALALVGFCVIVAADELTLGKVAMTLLWPIDLLLGMLETRG